MPDFRGPPHSLVPRCLIVFDADRVDAFHELDFPLLVAGAIHESGSEDFRYHFVFDDESRGVVCIEEKRVFAIDRGIEICLLNDPKVFRFPSLLGADDTVVFFLDVIGLVCGKVWEIFPNA